MHRTANRTVLEHRSMMRTLEGKVSKQREMTGHSFSITSKHGCSVPAGAEEGATNLEQTINFQQPLLKFWVEEDTFEMYLRYGYRYMTGCIFCIFKILRYRYH